MMEIDIYSDEGIVKPAEQLPPGWKWYHWADGSGSLRDPNGAWRFQYDLLPGANWGGIEYQDTRKQGWDWFYGDLEEFKEFAEKRTLQELQPPEVRIGPRDSIMKYYNPIITLQVA